MSPTIVVVGGGYAAVSFVWTCIARGLLSRGNICSAVSVIVVEQSEDRWGGGLAWSAQQSAECQVPDFFERNTVCG